MNRPELIYETPPRYAVAAFAGVIGLLIGVDIVFALVFPELLCFMMITAISESALFYFIIPRKYQIFADRLRVVLGGWIKFDVPFSTIRQARVARSIDAFVYWGLRMATSGEGVVEILRRGGGLDLVISPIDRDTFLEQLDQALAASNRNATPPKWRVI
ncbi:hypothetical protein ABFB09_01700 [Dehalogenimonas sp. THU2]|uniref:hypothetical protein n=1 Tax=Dehalogenimonas sp. THU2 TaxID=3151121 RepID=UPI0032189E34